MFDLMLKVMMLISIICILSSIAFICIESFLSAFSGKYKASRKTAERVCSLGIGGLCLFCITITIEILSRVVIS